MHVPRISARDLFADSHAEAAIFDMDGVLADTVEFHVEAWVRSIEQRTGADAPVDLIRETFGQTNDLIIPKLWGHVGKEPNGTVDEISREKERFYREAAKDRVRPLEGVVDFLEWLVASDIPLAVGTSGPPENVQFLLEEFGWTEYFTAVVDRSCFAAGKPAPDCFLKASELLAVVPNETLVFEDSIHGLLAARRGGFQPCAVSTSLPESVLRPHARWVFRDFRDIAC